MRRPLGQPSAALLLPCQAPELVPDPETASDKQVEVERVNVARAYVDCRQRHPDMVTFVKLGYVKGGTRRYADVSRPSLFCREI